MSVQRPVTVKSRGSEVGLNSALIESEKKTRVIKKKKITMVLSLLFDSRFHLNQIV